MIIIKIILPLLIFAICFIYIVDVIGSIICDRPVFFYTKQIFRNIFRRTKKVTTECSINEVIVEESKGFAPVEKEEVSDTSSEQPKKTKRVYKKKTSSDKSDNSK